MEFKDNLKEILKERGISQRQLSEMTGITEATISKYSKGERVPSITNALKISESLGVSIDFLVGNEAVVPVERLITTLDMLSNDMTLSVSKCLEYYQAKLVIERVEKILYCRRK